MLPPQFCKAYGASRSRLRVHSPKCALEIEVRLSGLGLGWWIRESISLDGRFIAPVDLSVHAHTMRVSGEPEPSIPIGPAFSPASFLSIGAAEALHSELPPQFSIRRT